MLAVAAARLQQVYSISARKLPASDTNFSFLKASTIHYTPADPYSSG